MDKKETLTENGNVAIHDWEPYTSEGNHKNADEIEHDIEETRHVMDELLDVLSSRVNPGNVVNRMMNSLKKPQTREKARDVLYNTVSRASSSFQRNPLPLMIIAAGITWQLLESYQEGPKLQTDRSKGRLRSGTESAENRFSETADQIRDKAAEAKENLKERFSSMGEQARDAFKSNEEKAHRSYDKVQTHAENTLGGFQQESGKMRDQLGHSFKDTAGRADQSFHDNPLLFGMAAVFAGFLLGSLFPETKTEHNVFSEKSEDIKEKASEKVLSKDRDTSQSFAQDVRSADATPNSTENQEGHETDSNKEGLNGEKQKPVTPVLLKSSKENQNGVLKTAEQKIDEKKSKDH